MSEPKVARDAAEFEFKRFAEMMDLNIDVEDMNDDEKESFKGHHDLIIKSIMKGSLSINDEGEPMFIPQRSENKNPITFREPDGSALQAMDRKGKSEDIGKMFNAMGAVTGEAAKRFSMMKYSDLKICMALITLFLA